MVMGASSSRRYGSNYYAIVVGSGPNGLSAAIELARSRRSVLVVEASEEIGGGARTKELTLDGFRHDVCSAVHPLGASSPFFRSLSLEEYGLTWEQPAVLAAHPLPDGEAAALFRDVVQTAERLAVDGSVYRERVGELVARWPGIARGVLGPGLHIPRQPRDLARFGLIAGSSASWFAGQFEGAPAQALVAGMAAHANVPLDRLLRPELP